MTTANLTVIENVLFKRGNTAVTSAYTGVPGEIVVDTTLKTLRVQDGVTAGGTRLATHAELANVSVGGNVDLSDYATIVQLNSTDANVANLQSNAGTQATQINLINANIANVAPSLTNGVYQLKLQANGNVTVPSGVHFIVPENGNIALRATGTTGNAHVEWHNDATGDRATVRYSATGVEVYTTSSGVQRSWLFHPDGSTHFPQYTFPLGAGAPDSYLKSDGLGTLNWATTHGNLIPAANVTYSLGNSTNQWKELWVSNSTVYIGGVPLSVTNGQLLVGGAPVTGNVGSVQPYVELTNIPFILQPAVLGEPVTVTAAPQGVNARFTVVIGEGPTLDSVTITTAGTGYSVGQIYRIWSYNIGGPNDVSSIEFEVATVGELGELLTIANAALLPGASNFPGTYNNADAELRPSVFDTVGTGLTLTRGRNQGLYNSESELDYDNNNYTSPAGTEWNSDGWGNLLGLGQRSYTTWRAALNNQVGNNIVGAELIMHDTINDRYYKFDFTAWGENNGAFAYTRTEITDPNYFRKTDYGEEIDIIVPDDGAGAGIGITRGNNNSIYNPYREEGYNQSTSPDGTLWNIDGWDDLSDIETRTYSAFYAAYNGNLGNRVPGSQAVMYVPDNGKYYAIQWFSWTQNNNGGGFSYYRRELDLTKLNEGVKFADGSVLKSAEGVGRVKLTATGDRRIEEVHGYNQVSVTGVNTINLTTTASRTVTGDNRFWVLNANTTIDEIINDPNTYGIIDYATIQFSLDNNIWYSYNGGYSGTGTETGVSTNGSHTYNEGDTIYFRYNTGGAPQVWWDSADLPGGSADFRGAVIDYHAFTGEATWVGTIHIVKDSGEEHITHTEVASGSTDAENDDLWRVQNEGTISYRRIDGEAKTLKIQWSARVFYGSEFWD